MIAPQTQSFMNLVVNPLDSNKPAQVPDMQLSSSLCLVDSIHMSLPLNVFGPAGVGAAIRGLLIFLRTGYSDFDNKYCPPNTAKTWYSLGYVGINANGQPIF